ncbi:hypothetical protein C8F04DRAFT_1155012 [Mycena alexandri]|uniref:Secreted protein n=1 Tax=Mycena alexandri TaxID=1745969 RepID=A0AAD6WQY3_9AGAR|nr:hypothetical protein C8F04DRAFT_1155012 [Mycena alexandri]
MTRRLILLLSAVFVPRTSQHRCILPASPSPTCVVCVPPISACLASRTCFHLAQLQPKLPNIYLFVTLTRKLLLSHPPHPVLTMLSPSETPPSSTAFTSGSMYSSVPRWADVVWFMETPYLRGIATWFQVRIHTIRFRPFPAPQVPRQSRAPLMFISPTSLTLTSSLYTALFVRASSVHSRV